MINMYKKRIIITIKRETYEKLEQRCKEYGQTKSEFVEEAIIEELNYLDDQDKINKRVQEIIKNQERRKKTNEK